jgi:hypothetical protein
MPLQNLASLNATFSGLLNVSEIAVFFSFSGKLYCVIDESPENYIALQSSKQPMQSAEFNKKLTLEKELAKTDMVRFGNAEFDRTGNFLLYPSLIGEIIIWGKNLKINIF